MTAAPTAGGVVTSGVGVAGVGVGLLGMFGPVRVVHVGWLLPLSGVHIELDRLGGFFMALTGAVAAPVGCYLIGYVRREHLGRVPMAVVPLFVAAMLLVPAAGSVTTFLLAWELMAIASLILVLSEHARPQVRSAGLWYAVMTQLGFIAILVGLVVLAAAGGSDRLAGLGAVCDGVRAAVFMLTLVGFGSKAGLVPLHAWLPRAHPEAPSPVSALMSAAMVNLGIYGIVRFDLQLLGPGPRWWGLALLAVGGTSALYGVLQASVAADLKRLLAYSTTENMGLITLALAALAVDLAEVATLTLANSVVYDRFAGTAVLHPDDASALGCLGYVARASGLRSDARVEHPTIVLPITEIGAPDGDVLARYTVRRDEFAASAALAQHIVESHTGPIEYAATLHPVGAPSSGIGIVEGWRGTIVHRVEIDVDGRITRAKVVDPSWFNWPALPVAMADTIVPDFPLANKSFNQSYAGNDL